MTTNFLFSRTKDAQDLPLPSRATPHSAGMDLHANIHEDILLKPGKCERIPTGICTAMPPGYEAQIRPRSGLAYKYGVTMLNAPGTIDADYRGEIHAILINLGDEPYIIRRGDRIAQMVIASVVLTEFTEVDDLPDSIRGKGGFGHSGV